MRNTPNQPATIQAYVLPIPNGWGVVTYGDSMIPDDEIVPLPYGSAMAYDEVLANFAKSKLGSEAAMIDGWETAEQLAEWEPELYRRAWR